MNVRPLTDAYMARPQYRVHAALDGWNRVFEWFGKYLR